MRDEKLNPSRRLVLASASPRRRQILGVLGVPFEATEMAVDEAPRHGEAPEQTARRLAVAKARAGAARYPISLVLAADTVVALEAEALGKPLSEAEAIETLQRLRGRAHRVITAVALAQPGEPGGELQVASRVSTTQVWMRDYTDDEIQEYVATGDPFDKAGSYAIQHLTFRPVERIAGCFLNVVGLPLPEVSELLRGVEIEPHVDAGALEAVCPGCADAALLPGS